MDTFKWSEVASLGFQSSRSNRSSALPLACSGWDSGASRKRWLSTPSSARKFPHLLEPDASVTLVGGGANDPWPMEIVPFAFPAIRPERVVAATMKLVLSPNSAGRSALQCSHFLNRVGGDLVRKDTDLLVGDWLPIDAERRFCVFTERVKHAVRVCRHTGDRQRQDRTQSSIHTFAGQIVNEPGTNLRLSDIQGAYISRSLHHCHLLTGGFDAERNGQVNRFRRLHSHSLSIGSEARGMHTESILSRFDTIETKFSACARFGVEPSIGDAQLQSGPDDQGSAVIIARLAACHMPL